MILGNGWDADFFDNTEILDNLVTFGSVIPVYPFPFFSNIINGNVYITYDFRLRAGSPLIDNGTIIQGFHCSRADDNSSDPYPSSDTSCVHWYGNAPDIGAYEYNPGIQTCMTQGQLNIELKKFVDMQIGIVPVTNKVVSYLGC